MKFHLFASLVGNKQDYARIFKVLRKTGHEAVTEHVLHRTIEEVQKETSEQSHQYYKKMVSWVEQADFIVFEVTYEEISIGFEMNLALEKEKPIIVLYRKDKQIVPSTLKGVTNQKFQMYEYDSDDEKGLELTLQSALDYVCEQIDKRFTMLMPPNIVRYLDKIAQTGNSRSAYIRELIEKDMEDKV